jgi:hypothetical protein
MEVLRLFIPLISVGYGIFLKYSKKEDLNPLKKYWLFLIIAGTLLFVLRLYDILK